MIDTGLLVVVAITFTMLLSVLILLSYDFEQWCPQVSNGHWSSMMTHHHITSVISISPLVFVFFSDALASLALMIVTDSVIKTAD